MASAMIGGLFAARDPGLAAAAIRVVEIDSSARKRLSERFGVSCFEAVGAKALEDSGVVVLAVKPQQMRSVAAQLGPLLNGQIVLTIAAGIRLKDLMRWLGTRNCVLVRAMPNTPALVMQGISGLYSLAGVSQAQRSQAGQILEAVGEIVWLDDETQMDAVTALSGSGPAYVFYFIEAMQEAALELGLNAETARRLSLGTFLGASRLAIQSEEDTAVLRARVTSKGGTTERAIGVMESAGIKASIKQAVHAAA